MMKNLTSIVAVLAIAAASASAQTKLWTWKAEITKLFRELQNAVLNEDGSGAFALAERDTLNFNRSHLLVWVDKRGKVLLSERQVLPPGEYWRGFSFLFPDKDKLIVLRYTFGVADATLYHADGRKSLMTGPSPGGENKEVHAFPTFKGWLTMEGAGYRIREPGAIPPLDEIRENTDTITAWTFR